MRRTTPRIGAVLFAVTLVSLVTALSATAASARTWLGVYTQQITGELRDGMDLRSDGVLVDRVVPDSPADRAGLRQGDVITRFNSRAVESPQHLAEMVGSARDGQGIALEISRHGENRTLEVTLGSRSDDDRGSADDGADDRVAPAPPRGPDDMRAPAPPDAPEAPEAPTPPGGHEKGTREVRVKIVGPDGKGSTRSYRLNGDEPLPEDVRGLVREFHDGMPGMSGGLPGLARLQAISGRGRLGVRIESLSDDLAGALDAPGREGVLVLEVIKDTPAARAGLRAGDVILSVDGHGVKDANDLVQAVRDADGKVSLSVSRKGTRRTVEASLDRSPREERGDGTGPGRMGDMDHVMRFRGLDGADRDDLRRQIEELRQQLRELRHQLEENHRN